MKIQARRASEGVGTTPRLRVGLVLKPFVQLLAAISSAHPKAILHVASLEKKFRRFKIRFTPLAVAPLRSSPISRQCGVLRLT